MEVCVLGSGSAGNCTLVRLGGELLMIDAGFGPRATAKRLTGTGASVAELRAVLLTHLDHDHFRPTWLPVLAERRITLYCHERHLYELYRHESVRGVDARVLHRQDLLRTFTDQPFEVQLTDRVAARVQPVALQHDSAGTVGYRIEATGRRLAYATDLGRVTEPLIEAMVDADLVALESNYDGPMQLASDRPWILKRRIMGGAGHLSNEQAMQAIREALSRGRRTPRHIVLLHLSRQCNCPKLVRELFSTHPQVAPRLCITSQHEPTPWLAADHHDPLPGEQLSMF